MSPSTSALDGENPRGPSAAPTKFVRKPSGKVLLMGALGVIAALGGGYYLLHRGLEATDDAQVDAELVALPSRASGIVAKVVFSDNQLVKAGDVLAELDAEQAKARLAQAAATLEAASAAADAADADARVTEKSAKGNRSVANAARSGATSGASMTQQQISEGDAMVASGLAGFEKARMDLERSKKLGESGAIAQAQIDQAQAAFDTASAVLTQAKAHLASARAAASQAQSRVLEANARFDVASDVELLVAQARARARMAHAQVATAESTRDLAALDLSYTKILAPQDGYVSKKAIAVGQMVAVGQSIAQLVPAQQVWITGNFKETQLARMRVGQPAHVDFDAFPGVTIEGEVESFSAATGSRFTLLPPDNATGNFTKVVQRVPVRVRLGQLPPGVTLRPGMSVELSVDTRK